MGLLLSRLSNLFKDWSSSGETKILLLGLDAAGKTTVLYKLKLNETVQTIPTIGFNVETVTPVKGLNFTMWDVGGQEKIRPLWRHYFMNTDGLVFVVDSNDPVRLKEAQEELHGMFEDPDMARVPVLVLANKQDLPNAMSPSRIVEGLELPKLKALGHDWHIQGTCAVNGEGIYEGMHELAHMVKARRKAGR